MTRRQRRRLRRIDRALRVDPDLAAMLAIFSRIHADEPLPGREQLRAPAARLWGVLPGRVLPWRVLLWLAASAAFVVVVAAGGGTAAARRAAAAPRAATLGAASRIRSLRRGAAAF